MCAEFLNVVEIILHTYTLHCKIQKHVFMLMGIVERQKVQGTPKEISLRIEQLFDGTN